MFSNSNFESPTCFRSLALIITIKEMIITMMNTKLMIFMIDWLIRCLLKWNHKIKQFREKDQKKTMKFSHSNIVVFDGIRGFFLSNEWNKRSWRNKSKSIKKRKSFDKSTYLGDVVKCVSLEIWFVYIYIEKKLTGMTFRK